jgi:hypothetical protein
MNAPGIRRYRRTFMAPLWVGLIAALMVMTFLLLLLRWTATPSTVVLLAVPASESAPATESLRRLGGALGPASQFDTLLAERGAIDALAIALGVTSAERLGVDSANPRALAQRLRWRMRGHTVLVALPPAAAAALLSQLAGAANAPQAAAATATDRRLWVVTLTGFGPPAVLDLHP